MSAKAQVSSPRSGAGSDARKSAVLPQVVKENISVKTIKLLGDKKLMPRAARKRLGSSLSGKQLHEYIEAMKHENLGEERDADSNGSAIGVTATGH
jgi:hypothetical protein